MLTHGDGLGTLVREISERGRKIASLEAELAALELRGKAATMGVGIASLVAAAVVVLFAIGFFLAGAAAGLAIVLPLWASLLIVGVALVAIAAALGLVGRSRLRSAAPLVPEQALEEA